MKYSLLLLSCMTLCYAEETDDLVAAENGKIFTLGAPPPRGVEVIQAQSDEVVPSQVEVIDENTPVIPTPAPVAPPTPAAPTKVRKIPLSHKTMKKGKYGVFVTGDWLFWTVHEGGLEFAVKQSLHSNPNLLGNLPSGHARRLSFDWSSGFRVGTGSHFGPDLWDIYASYTRFTPHGKKHVSAEAIFPLLYYPGRNPMGLVSRAHAHASIQFNAIDLELGREIFLTRRLSLRPHFGVKGATIWQNCRVGYFNSLDNTGTVLAEGKVVSIKEHNRFKGAGLTAGFDGSWYCGKGINLFANGTAGLLYGLFKMRQSQLNYTSNLTPVLKVIDLDSNLHQFNPMVQLLIGLGWDYKFCKEAFHIGLGASYEVQYWWKQNQMERFTAAAIPTYVRNSEDLAFHGLTVSLRFDF